MANINTKTKNKKKTTNKQNQPVGVKQNVNVKINLGTSTAKKRTRKTRNKSTYNPIYQPLQMMKSLGVVSIPPIPTPTNIQQGYKDDEYKKGIEGKIALIESRQEAQKAILDNPRKSLSIIDNVVVNDDDDKIPKDELPEIFGDSSNAQIIHKDARIVAGSVTKDEFDDIMADIITKNKIFDTYPNDKTRELIITELKKNVKLNAHKGLSTKVNTFFKNKGILSPAQQKKQNKK